MMFPERSMLRQWADRLSVEKVLAYLPPRMSQVLTTPVASQLASRSPLTLNLQPVTAPWWPQKVWMHSAILVSQIERVLSALAEASRLEVGWKCTLLTESTCPLKTLRHLPTLISSNLHEASRDPVATQSPVRLRSMLHTGWRWSLKVKVQVECTKSHTLTVLSPEPVRMWWPRGWNFIELTQSRWPYPDIISSDWFTVHIFQNMSSLPVPMIGFLGWKTTVHTDIVWPF